MSSILAGQQLALSKGGAAWKVASDRAGTPGKVFPALSLPRPGTSSEARPLLPLTPEQAQVASISLFRLRQCWGAQEGEQQRWCGVGDWPRAHPAKPLSPGGLWAYLAHPLPSVAESDPPGLPQPLSLLLCRVGLGAALSAAGHRLETNSSSLSLPASSTGLSKTILCPQRPSLRDNPAAQSTGWSWGFWTDQLHADSNLRSGLVAPLAGVHALCRRPGFSSQCLLSSEHTTRSDRTTKTRQQILTCRTAS